MHLLPRFPDFQVYTIRNISKMDIPEKKKEDPPTTTCNRLQHRDEVTT